MLNYLTRWAPKSHTARYEMDSQKQREQRAQERGEEGGLKKVNERRKDGDNMK